MRKRTRSNPNPNMKSGVSVVLIVAAVAYFGWCAINYYQTKEWSWTPWKQLELGSQQIKLIER